MQQFLYSPQNEWSHKHSKVAAVKNFLPSMHAIDITCFDECSLSLCDHWKTMFFVKVYHYPKDFSNHHIVAFFEISVLKEVCLLHYLHNNITTLISKFQNQLVVCNTC